VTLHCRHGFKILHRVNCQGQAAKKLLTVRERNLELLRSGELLAGNELEGKTVSAQIDGARTRIRSVLEELCPIEKFGKSQSEATGKPSLGRSKEARRRAMFEALWRELNGTHFRLCFSSGRARALRFRCIFQALTGRLAPFR